MSATEVTVCLDWSDKTPEIKRLFKDGPFEINLDGATKIEGSVEVMRELAITILRALPQPASDDPLIAARALVLEWCDGDDGPLEQAVQLLTNVIELQAISPS